MEPDIQAYIAVMEEIKRRTEVILALLNGEISVMYRAIQVESIVLQIRMITELIALASLSANKSIFEKNRKKFKKLWHPAKILKDVENLNPNFYPVPIIEVPSKNSRVKTELIDMKTGFMNRDELIRVHGECGNLLHAENPFGKGTDYSYYEARAPKWMDRIMRLLNCHQIKLLNEDSFYLVHMKEERDNQVHMYTFGRSENIDGM